MPLRGTEPCGQVPAGGDDRLAGRSACKTLATDFFDHALQVGGVLGEPG